MSNDLISRSALKKWVDDSISQYGNQYSTDMFNMFGMFKEVIDNAPTVELTELCKGCQYLKDCETCDMRGEISVCQNPNGNCFTCKLFEVCNAKTKPANMRGEDK